MPYRSAKDGPPLSFSTQYEHKGEVMSATAKVEKMQMFVGVAEAAKILGVSKWAIYLWSSQKHSGFPVRKHGRLSRFLPDELRAWSDSNKKYKS
jgi:predicted DNA-binding transcriptional regulator AlpA